MAQLDVPGRLKARLDELKGRVCVESLTIAKRPPEKQLRRAAASIGKPLPPALQAFYEQCNGISLHVVHEASALEGRLELLPIEQMFGGRDGARAWDDEAFRGQLWLDDFAGDLLAKEVATFRRLRPLEWYLDWKPTCIDAGGKSPRLYLVDRWNLKPSVVTLAQYFTAAIETLGLTGWREALWAPAGRTAKEFARSLRAFVATPAARREARAKTARTKAAQAGSSTGERRVELRMGHQLLGMTAPRGTVLAVEGRRIAVDLDAGPRGWVDRRKVVDLGKPDLYEQLRAGTAWPRLCTRGSPALERELCKWVGKPDDHTFSWPRVSDVATEPPISAITNARAMFGASRTLPEVEAATRLLSIAGVLLDGAGIDKAGLGRLRLACIALCALHLRVLHEGLQRGSSGLRGVWPADLVATLEATLARALAFHYAAPLAPIRALVDRVPAAPEIFYGASWNEPAVAKPTDRTTPETWLDLDRYGAS